MKDLLSPENDFRKLRMFEDLNRKGSVVIQGLEEVLVKNADDVINILQKGSLKRQIAATKMNESSSRSHAIFSITVHIKECTSDGEDLLKVITF
jgi:kinesin family member 11